MTTSTPPFKTDRKPIGQILVRLLHQLRTESFREGTSKGSNLRFPHVQVIANLVGVDAIRLTDLANRATLSMAACSELVNELESLGYIERQADPTDGRAKLIVPTELGRRMLSESQKSIRRLEQRWADHCPPGAFEEACRTLDRLLHDLEARHES
jgi:DNA-binding MarR family transcriptional regulator